MDLKILNDVYNNEYFRINKILQETTGLWPYSSRLSRILKRIFVTFVCFMLVIPHASAVYKWCGKNLGLCTENICGVAYTLGLLLKFLVSLISEHEICKLYEQLAETWISIADPEEKAIMEKWARLGRMKSLGYIAFLAFAGTCFCQFSMIPVILDFIIPLNQSRPKILIVKGEFYVDSNEYFYEIYYIYSILVPVSVTVLMAIDTTYTAIVHQNLGVFNVIKYRLKNVTQCPTSGKDDAYNVIISAIRLHQDSIKCIQNIESTYEKCFLILIIICITFLSFGAITIIENSTVVYDLIRMTMIEIGTAVHLFYLSWPGQLVIDESYEIFVALYMNGWYDLTKRSKTLVKIMMMRCTRPSFLSAAGLYVMNFQNYGIIIKTTVSYITVLSSFRA